MTLQCCKKCGSEENVSEYVAYICKETQQEASATENYFGDVTETTTTHYQIKDKRTHPICQECVRKKKKEGFVIGFILLNLLLPLWILVFLIGAAEAALAGILGLAALGISLFLIIGGIFLIVSSSHETDQNAGDAVVADLLRKKITNIKWAVFTRQDVSNMSLC